MSILAVYSEHQPQAFNQRYTDFAEIQDELKSIGVQFERWPTRHDLPDDADASVVLAAYDASIQRLTEQYGFQSMDVVNVTPDLPDKDALRQKFLAEHVHDDFEVRFFIDGCGLFYLHVGDKVYAVLCEQGDLISVPANTTHWFDMGEHPRFRTIRLFTTPYGWVANFTGNPVAAQFPTLDQFVASQA